MGRQAGDVDGMVSRSGVTQRCFAMQQVLQVAAEAPPPPLNSLTYIFNSYLLDTPWDHPFPLLLPKISVSAVDLKVSHPLA